MPMMPFSLKALLEKACSNRHREIVAVAAAEDSAVIGAAVRAKELGLIAPVFIGNQPIIEKLLSTETSDLNGVQIINTASQPDSAKVAVDMILKKEAAFLMKGMVSTKDLLGEVVHKKKGIAGQTLLSHLALFEIPNYPKLLALTDAAMNIAPDRSEKMLIIRNAVQALNKLGLDRPGVALLAAIEKVNPKIAATVDAQSIMDEHMKTPLGDCDIQGPLSLDGAISRHASELKGMKGKVAGQADLLVVPELNAGNILYKSMIYFGGAETAGVILGAESPIILTSRADSEKSKLYSIALAKCLC